MKAIRIAVPSLWIIAGSALTVTIVYSYDEQHRLVGVTCSRSVPAPGALRPSGQRQQATISYARNEAYNLTEYNALTCSC